MGNTESNLSYIHWILTSGAITKEIITLDLADHRHHLDSDWCWKVESVQAIGSAVVVTGCVTIPTADGDLLHYSAAASESLESTSKAPAAEVAASSCLRRAAALAGLGLELWG